MIRFVRLDHVLISIPVGTRDMARQFYTQVLQLTELDGNHPRGALWFQIGDVQLHVREESDHQGGSCRHPAFEVEDIDVAKTCLQEQAIPISCSTEIDGRDRCFFWDPWGNRFELLEYH